MKTAIEKLDEDVKKLEATINENDVAIKGLQKEILQKEILQKEIEMFKKNSMMIGYVIFAVVFLIIFLVVLIVHK